MRTRGLSALLLGLVFATAASACPLCAKGLLEDKDNTDAIATANAFNFSILFMLSAPVILMATFGATVYRLHHHAMATDPNYARLRQIGMEEVMPPARSSPSDKPVGTPDTTCTASAI